MANIGKAIQSMGQGIVQGLEIGEMQKRTKVAEGNLALDREKFEDTKLQEALLLNVREKEQSLKEQQLKFDKKKMVIDILPSLMGEKGITPNRKDAVVKSILDQTGFDISEFFRPQKDPKTGVVNSFMLHDKDSINNKLDNEANMITALAAKSNAAANMLEANIKKTKLDSGIYQEPIEYVQDLFKDDDVYKASSPMEKAKMVAEATLMFDAKMSERQANLEPGTIKQIELDMYSTIKKVNDTKRVADTYSKEFLTWPGKIRNWSIDKILKAGSTAENTFNLSEEDRKYARDYSRFHASINRIFVSYVHDMSGAQYSVKEMETHKQSLFNPSMNYEAFKGVYNDFVDDMKKGYRIRKQLLEEGFTGDGKALGTEINRLYNLPNDPTQSEESLDNRMRKLQAIIGKDKNLSNEEKEALIIDTMRSEGYEI